MTLKSASETIKKLNPKNISGTIPQALDMVKQLQQVKGNPKMIESIGGENLMAAFKHILELFTNKKKKQSEKTPEELAEEQALVDQIKKLETDLEKLIGGAQ